MIVSKLTSKGQTTIPQPIREALRVSEGDELAYAIDNGRVILRKAPSRAIRLKEPGADDPFATFGEWDSEADRRAFADL